MYEGVKTSLSYYFFFESMNNWLGYQQLAHFSNTKKTFENE